MPNRSTSIALCIYSDLDHKSIYVPEQLLAQNDWFEPLLTDLQVDDEVEVYSADGRDYRGLLAATTDDVEQWRKLLSAKIATRIYSQPNLMLADLTDDELEALLIFRGLNA